MNFDQFVGTLIFFLVVNVIAFFVMMIDKVQSRKSGNSRISEGLLFFMAVFFGSLGVYAGMFVLRHKTRKWYFIIGIPMLIIQNISFLYLFSDYWIGIVKLLG
ncbi:MAG: DUF1294 domain-containing protein [Candidatus Moranbacteria bacterium]|nr:DUF1294 domain-containing protein [Candidatus Moranbacteria bacterium]